MQICSNIYSNSERIMDRYKSYVRYILQAKYYF